MPGMGLDELIGKLRQGGLQPTAEDVADALWLARRLGAASSGGGDGGDPGTDAPGAPSARPPGPEPDAVPPDALTAAAPGTPQTPRGDAP
ncbi:hypothetical protein L0F81_42675, partial [Streptomyces tricolor]|nr:hypothetical protein [Streptomyces tricolor]